MRINSHVDTYVTHNLKRNGNSERVWVGMRVRKKGHGHPWLSHDEGHLVACFREESCSILFVQRGPGHFHLSVQWAEAFPG